MPFAIGKNTPFAEQLAFFKAKLNLPTERWDDIMRSAHDRAFVVAGAANADLLDDLNSAIARGIETGSGLDAFRADFKQIVQKHGWTGWTGEGTAAGEAWRTRVIYETNVSTSYAAGRWQQLNNPDLLALRPYWKYVHADGVAHPRPLHVSWNGLVLPNDHEFWKTHFPPNGWFCHCRVAAVDARAYAAAADAGKAAPPDGWRAVDGKTGSLVGIDKGFDYAPGATAGGPLQNLVNDRIMRLAAPIGSRLYEAVQPVLEQEQAATYLKFVEGVLADPVERGRSVISGAIEADTVDWLAAQGQAPATAEIAVPDHLIVAGGQFGAVGETVGAQEWLALRDRLAAPSVVLFDTRSGRLVYVLPAPEAVGDQLAVELAFRRDGAATGLNELVDSYRLSDDTIAAGLEDGRYQKVR